MCKGKTIALVVLAFGACFPALSAAAMLDQQYLPRIDLGARISEGFRYIAQTVTAGQQGYLTEADLGVFLSGTANDAWEVTVQGCTNGVPNGNVLVVQDLPASAAGTFGSSSEVPMQVVFSSPAFFNAGDQFALVIQAPSATPGAGHTVGIWDGAFDQPYPGGLAYQSNDDKNFAYIGAKPNYALAFETFVSVPEPAPATYMALALAALTCRRTRLASRRVGI